MMPPNFDIQESEGENTTMVECRSVRRIIAGRVILDQIDLRVGLGERICILGESGSGKTTLLRILAGLDPPHSGKALLQGRDVYRTPPRERRIGMLFQRASVYPHMTVAIWRDVEKAWRTAYDEAVKRELANRAADREFEEKLARYSNKQIAEDARLLYSTQRAVERRDPPYLKRVFDLHPEIKTQVSSDPRLAEAAHR